MNIVGIFLNNEMRTGANRRYLELMEGLASRGNRVFVLMNTYLDYTPVFFSRIDIPVLYKRRKFPPASYLFKKNIRKNLQTIRASFEQKSVQNIEWIHIHGDMHLPAAVYLKKELKAKLFFAFRCNDIERALIIRKSGHLSLMEFFSSCIHELVNRMREKQVSRTADLVTFQNSVDRDDFVRRTAYSPAQTVLIPGNIGLPRFSAEWENRNASVGVKTLVYVGALSVSKGLQYLLEALALLKERGHGDLKLFVLGKTDEADLVNHLLDSLGIREMVSIEGYTLPFPYLARCDLMVYPTLYDAFPDTLLEALHVACPVIASSVGGIPDLLSYPELLFASGNVHEIADCIEHCIQDSSWYLHLRTLCAARAVQFRFDWAERFEIAMKKL